MLAVLGILCLLTAATLPSLLGLSLSSGRAAAVEEVMAALDHARALALARGRPAYVVFADASVAGGRACRAFGVYLENEDPAEAPSLVARWNVLPPGCRFLDDATADSLFTAPGEMPVAPRFLLPGGHALQALPYLKFAATGAVAHPAYSTWARLYLASAHAAPGSRADEISVALFTGRPKCQIAPFSPSSP